MQEFTTAELARLADYFARELDPGEAEAVEEWVHERPERQRIIADLRRSRLELGRQTIASAPPDLAERGAAVLNALTALRAAPATVGEPAPRHTMERERHPSSRPVFGIVPRTLWQLAGASAIALLVLVSGLWLTNRGDATDGTPGMATYVTGNGERATITLADGSVVTLNVASRIQVPADYMQGNRILDLQGEALFSVSHRDGTPFAVVAGPSRTRVLGTRFVVRYYDADSSASVAVQEGKVMVQSTVLTASQQVVVGWSGIGTVQQGDSSQFGFAKGVLILDNVALKDAVPALNRWFDVDIRFEDPEVGERRITSTLSPGAIGDLAAILDPIFRDIGVVRSGRILTLYQR